MEQNEAKPAADKAPDAGPAKTHRFVPDADQLARYELGIDKIYEEVYRLERKLDTEDMSDAKRMRLRNFQEGLCMALTYMTSDRPPKLKENKK